MVKIDLSAMKKTANSEAVNSEINDLMKEDISISDQIPKKKISLNTLISNTSELKNIPKNTQLDKVETNKTKVKTKLSLSNDLWISLPKIEVENVSEDQNLEIEKKEEEKEEEIEVVENEVKLENKVIEELTIKKDESEEKSNSSILVADWDTIWNLIVESNTNELFSWYVSSFDKEMQLLKNKKKNKSKTEDLNIQIKSEEKKTDKIIEELKEKEIDLDKIIEEVKEKEIKDENINISENIKNKKNKVWDILNIIKKSKKFKISALSSVLVLFIALWVFYYSQINKTLTDTNVKVNVLENKSNNLPNKTGNTDLNNINTIKKPEVNQKLIKYFKNKQNNVKIDKNKN